LEEPSPDHREALWGSDFRSFIPSPIANSGYALDEIVKSLGENNLEAPTPHRSSYSCMFWIVVVVASVVLISTGIIVPLVVLNNARTPSQAKPKANVPYKPPLVASTDENTADGLQNYSKITSTNAIISQESEVHMQDEKFIKELDTLQTIKENTKNVKEVSTENPKDHRVDLKPVIENPKLKPRNPKNRLRKGLIAGLVMGAAAAGIQTVANKIYKPKFKGFKDNINHGNDAPVRITKVAIDNINNHIKKSVDRVKKINAAQVMKKIIQTGVKNQKESGLERLKANEEKRNASK
jgi:hypothetical protein